MIKIDECLDDLQNGLFIIQKQNGFKFGIDAVLLSDFAKDARSKKTLDLCTGTGIVPLLLSAKTATNEIHGLEIQEDIAEMAQRSVEYNKLSDRVFIECGDLKNATDIYGKSCFDKITCNPPYMKCGTGSQNDTDTKLISRHEVMCTLDDVVRTSALLLRPKGRFYMVHRPARIADIMCAMREYKIEPKRLRFVHPSVGKAPNMVLVEGIKDGGDELKILEPLYVYNDDSTYSEEIDRIYERCNSKKYSDNKECYYKISKRNDGLYHLCFFHKIVDEYRGKVTVTYHDVGDSHITDTLEKAIEVGDGMLEIINRAIEKENI